MVVIVKLMGGLGNQLFQYATGKALAERQGAPLKVDLSWYERDDRRGAFQLDRFLLPCEVATLEEIKRLKRGTSSIVSLLRHYGQDQIAGRLFSVTHSATSPQDLTYYPERTIDFDPAVMDLSDNVYLDGFWQCENYFCSLRQELLNGFQLREEPDKENRDILTSIVSSESVCLHIRRGDYLSDSSATQVHGICSPAYYERAIAYMKDVLHDPTFFIFSNDPAWVRERFDLGNQFVSVENNQGAGFMDLYLIKHCNHFVIANSTFSWWGAWLSEAKDNVVIGPRQWFSSKEYNDADRMPSSWIRMENQ